MKERKVIYENRNYAAILSSVHWILAVDNNRHLLKLESIRNFFQPPICNSKIRYQEHPSSLFDTFRIKLFYLQSHFRAIIPVHVYGNICNVEAIQQIAEKYRLKVIYV